MTKKTITPPPETTPITDCLWLSRDPSSDGWVGASSLNQFGSRTSNFKTVTLSFSLMAMSVVSEAITFNFDKLSSSLGLNVSLQANKVMLAMKDDNLQLIQGSDIEITDGSVDVIIKIHTNYASAGYRCFGMMTFRVQ